MTTSSALNVLTVTVQQNALGKWQCQPHDLPVALPDTCIVYTLATAGYAFAPQNPLTLRKSSVSFPNPPTRVSDTELTLQDLNTIPEVVRYDVHLVVLATNKVFRIDIDPIITNQPS